MVFNNKYILFIIFFIGLKINSWGQYNEYNFTSIESLLDKNKYNQALIKLNNIENIATKANDTSNLLIIYDYFIDIFENDTVNDNEKKFILKKIVLLKSYSVNKSKNIDDLVICYLKLAKFYQKEKEYYTEIDIYEKILQLLETKHNIKKEAEIYSKIGIAYQKNNKYANAIENYRYSISQARKIGDSLIVYNNLIFIGNLFIEIGEYSNAIFKYYRAQNLAKEINNPEKQSDAYIYLAKSFYILEMYEKAIEYSEKATSLQQKNSLIPSDIANMEQYIFVGKSYIGLDSIDIAINSFNNALFIAKNANNEAKIAQIYSLLGEAHSITEDYNLAENFLTKAFLIRKNIGDSLEICKSKLEFGKFYIKVNNFDQAKYYLINAFKYAYRKNIFSIIKEASKNLSIIFNEENNFEEAFKYQSVFIAINDSIFDKNKTISIEQLEAGNQYEINNKLITEQLEQLNERKTDLVLFIVILVLLMLSLFVTLMFFVFKNKEVARSKNLIETQKQIILKQYERYKLLSLVASNTENSIFIVDSNWKIEWVSSSLLKLYNMSHYEIFTKYEADFTKLSNGDLDSIRKICLEEKRPYSFTSLSTIKGKKKWIQTTISPIIENDIVEKLIGIETDITSLKIAQLEIQKQKKDIEYKNKLMDIYNQELKEQKESIVAQNEELRQQQEELQTHADLLEEYNKELQRLSFVASETDNIVYIFDLTGNLVWVNKAFVKHTGYTLNQYIEEFGQNIIEASTIESIDYYFYTCLEQKRSVKYVSELKTKYGRVMWVQTTLTPLKDKNGNVIEIVGIDADITETKNAERKITEQNKEIKSSLEYAGRIQRSVMPMPIFIKAIFDKHFIFNRPRDIVSGDFYFAHYINGRGIFALADSTGHGIPGAFMSLLGSMALKIVMTDLKTFDANIILNRLNNEIIKLLHQRVHKKGTIDSIDLAFCIFDFTNDMLDYSGANIPLYLARKNNSIYTINRIKPTKATIGFDANSKQFTVHSFKLEKGDRIYLSTDGLPDQFGGQNNKKLKRKGIIELLENINKISIEQQENALDVFLTQWSGNNAQVDDIMVVGIEY